MKNTYLEEKKMEGKKYFSGKLDKNVAFGLSWLIPVIAIIEIIIDKDVLDVEEKRDLVSLFAILVVKLSRLSSHYASSFTITNDISSGST